jgi:UDP-N-acetyl-D-glucosamine dehydrogenase
MDKIAIVGLGYVGLPLSIQLCQSGLSVIGLDINQEQVDKLNNGESYIKHILASDISTIVKNGTFTASADFSRISEVEAVIICVPTPLNKFREPDLSYVLATGRALAPYLDKGTPNKLVVLESTTYPGTTEDELRPILEEGSGLTAGKDFHLAFSPEREDPGQTDHSLKTIPKVIGGYTQACLDKCVALYSKAIDAVHPVSSCRVAEATKLTENIFRSVNIALVNELKIVYDKMGIDVWEVIDAAATKPFGYMPFFPGPGLGGHCIPIDPFYLTWKAREVDQHTRFIELAGEINNAMPEYVISKIVEALNSDRKSVNGSRILLLGIAYKPNVDDARESASYVLLEKLEARGAKVSFNDPHVPEIKPSREHSTLVGRQSVEITDDYDCIIVATHHDEYKTFDFSSYSCPIVDSRNCITNKPEKYYKA